MTMRPFLVRLLATLTDSLRRSMEPKHLDRTEIEPLLRSIPQDAVILEVGGGYRPRYRKSDYPNVYHLDHCGTEALRVKYAADPTVAHLVDDIQAIDFVSTAAPIETLVPPDLKFDVIYGSHVLEHQVDFIGHLQSLEKLLKPGGRVIEVIPDLRTCFDALRYPTVTSEVLLVHRQRPPVHQGKQVFDFESRIIDKNIGRRMRLADFKEVRFRHSLRDAYEAMLAADTPGQPYRDSHAWTFTPESFRLLMIELRLLDLTQLVPAYISRPYGNQFCAVLARTGAPLASMAATDVQQLERERLALAIQLRL
jgi:SAM-dependent methyltransferase